MCCTNGSTAPVFVTRKQADRRTRWVFVRRVDAAHENPTRASVCLFQRPEHSRCATVSAAHTMPPRHTAHDMPTRSHTAQDRKSTRLNSSHVAISYAVFCLKKKKK